MAAMILPRLFTYQPPQPTPINYGNPLTRGLVFLAIPQGGTLVNMVTGQRGVVSGSSPPTLANTVSGRALLHSGGAATNSYVDFGTSDPKLAGLALAQMTVFAWGAPTGVGGIAERNDGNAVNGGWMFGVSATGQLKLLQERASNNRVIQTNATLALGAPTSMAFTLDAVNPAEFLYIAGVNDATATLVGAGAGGLVTDAANSLFVGRNSFASAGVITTGSFAGNLEYVAMWNRVLSASEIAELHRNRYQLFKGGPSRRYVTPSLAPAASARPQVFVCT